MNPLGGDFVEENMTGKKRAGQGVLPFEYEGDPEGDEVTAWSGLPMVAELMRQLGINS